MVEKTMNEFSGMAPERAMVNVTGRCNSRCSYCLAWREDRTAGEPTLPELLHIVEQAAELGCKAVGFSGGEPLLRNDLEDIIRHVKGLGMYPVLVTNGVLLTEKRVHSLAEAGLGSLSMSLDTLDADLYQTIRGIPLKHPMENLVAAAALKPMPMGISVTVSARNVHSLDSLVAFAGEHGLLASFQLYADDVHLANADESQMPDWQALETAAECLIAMKEQGAPVTNTPEYLRSMAVFVRSGRWLGLKRCLGPQREICVDEALNLVTCWGMDRKIGSLRDADLITLWRSEAFDKARKELAGCRRCLLSCHFENSLRLLALEAQSAGKTA
jgi:MoaA/NifB/PqqE/SkfB family radical SAM enzyme